MRRVVPMLALALVLAATQLAPVHEIVADASVSPRRTRFSLQILERALPSLGHIGRGRTCKLF